MEATALSASPTPLLKLDLGAGKNRKEGFQGVDAIKFEGVDVEFDLRRPDWPWETSSVDEVYSSHFLEHLTNLDDKFERVNFFNELYRILKPGRREGGQAVGGFATLVFPHWNASRFYGDPTHKEPFSEFGFYYLDKNWRAANAPHSDRLYNPQGYNCDIECTWGYNLHQSLTVRGADYQQFAMQFFREACQDIIATLTARKEIVK